MELKEIKNKIEKSIIALATCDRKGNPHNIAVACVKIKEDKIIITDNYMQKTKKNIKNNPNIALVFWGDEEGFGIKGKAEYFDSGEWLKFIKSFTENKNHPAKGAIVINVEEIRKL
ncbi:MAG: pyridoxamine 5'-phosphate oxidase family protein [Nanoarchaeota archaeon]|nr:pyridoxamine 5'-phosphate oxidase family protein [Nanoarchaeota archaeon]